MTTNSYHGTVNTNSEWQTVTDATGFTFTEGKNYNMSISNLAYLRIAEAVFPFNNEKFPYVQTSDPLYIKTLYNGGAEISILEVS